MVKRYDLCTEEPSDDMFMDECEDGDYVKYSDYLELLATQTLYGIFDIIGSGYSVQIDGLAIVKENDLTPSPYNHKTGETK